MTTHDRGENRSALRRFVWPAFLLLLSLAAGSYLYFIRKNCSPYASNADASGYLNSARLLQDGRFTVHCATIDGLMPPEWNWGAQTALGFRHVGNGIFAPSYPVGYPLHLAAGAFVAGLDWAAVVVNVITVAAVGGLMIVFARLLGLAWGWGVAATAVLWASPVFIYQALQPMSDVLALMWCLVVMCCALKARAGSAWWSVAAGAAASIAVLVRPSDVLILIPLLGVFALRGRAWLGFFAGVVPGAVFQLWYNRQLYGAWIATGYGDMNWAFGAKYLGANARYFALGLPLHLSPLVALAGLGLPLLGRKKRFELVLFALWFGGFAGFYLWYYFSSTNYWWSVRFLLPAFPAVIFAAVLVVRELALKIRPPAARIALLLAVLGASLGWQTVAVGRLHAVIMKRGEVAYLHMLDWVKQHVEDSAIIVARQASGAFSFYATYPIVRYDIASRAEMQRLYAAAERSGRPVYAVFFAPEKNDVPEFPREVTAAWEKVFDREAFEVWRRPQPAAKR